MVLYKIRVLNHSQVPKKGRSDTKKAKKFKNYPFVYCFYVIKQ